MEETFTHRDAFEYYYGLGKDRNLTKVANQFKVSEATTHLWSGEFNWHERIILRDKKIADGVEHKFNVKLIEDKAQMLNVSKSIINLFVKGLKPDRIYRYKDPDTGEEKDVFTAAVTANKVEDFERAVNIYMKLTGESPEEEGGLKKREALVQELIDKINNIAGRRAIKDESESKPDDTNSDRSDSPTQ